MSKAWALVIAAACLVGCTDYSIRECASACKEGGHAMVSYNASSGCQCSVDAPAVNVTP